MIPEILIFLLSLVVSILVFIYKMFRGVMYSEPKTDLNGYVAIVTGGGNGIGKEVVKDLAHQGCTVIIADICDSIKVAEQINSELKVPKVSYEYIDLGDLQSIQSFVKKLQIPKLDFLVNNGGVMGGYSKKQTKSKHQLHYGVNYIGHYYLTHLLWEKLNKSSFFRIINLSSIAHKVEGGWKFFKSTTLQLDDYNFQRIPFSRDQAYSRSKLYLAAFTKSLADKIDKGKGLVVSVHPGIVKTNLMKDAFEGIYVYIHKYLLEPTSGLVSISVIEGAQTILLALYSQPASLKSGGYYAYCSEGKTSCLVDSNYKRIFQDTEKSLGITFGNAK